MQLGSSHETSSSSPIRKPLSHNPRKRYRHDGAASFELALACDGELLTEPVAGPDLIATAISSVRNIDTSELSAMLRRLLFA